MLIKVRVRTDSRKETVIKESDDLFVISVKEKPERNMTNKRLFEIFRAMYPGKSVKMIKGHRGPSKMFEIS